MELGLNNYYSFIGLASSQIQMNKRNIMMISIHGDPTAEIGSEEQGGQPMKKKIVGSGFTTSQNIKRKRRIGEIRNPESNFCIK